MNRINTDRLTGRQRRRLRVLAHHLKPLVNVGKNGVTDRLTDAVDNALADHELIKVRFREYKEERKELSTALANRTQSDLVDVIGNVAILYRRSPDPKKRKIRIRA